MVTGTLAKRRRVNTRQRLVDAGLTVFAERGFGQTTVAQVCEAADFTRGAFYSNFTSLAELYLEVWRQESENMIEQLRTAGDDLTHLPDVTIADAVKLVDSALDIDADWFVVSTEFTALATRQPDLLPRLEERERAIRNALAPILESVLRHFGRRAPDIDELCLAVVAVHEGTLIQCMTEPDLAAARARRSTLLTSVIVAYTVDDQEGTVPVSDPPGSSADV